MKIFIQGITAVAILFLYSCSVPPKKVMFQGQAQGTYYAVTYFDGKGRNYQPQIDSILKAFDLSVSMWSPGSIITRMNNGDTLVRADEWFADIFRRSEAIAVSTDGAFDFTVGPLVNAWGFGFKGKIKMDDKKVDSLLQFVDFHKVSMDDRGFVSKPQGFRFDFNAIAQGYSVDVIGKFLVSRGIENYLVDIGGEVLGKGKKPDGSSWVVGIENPSTDSLSERSLNARARLDDKALATSGNYRKYYEEDGIRYFHTIDPRTGYPVRHTLLSVSVLAGDCATADGYATAFMVMGFEKAKEFVEKRNDLEAYFISSSADGLYQTYETPGFKAILENQ